MFFSEQHTGRAAIELSRGTPDNQSFSRKNHDLPAGGCVLVQLVTEKGEKVDSVPQNAVFKYEWRYPRDVSPATKQKEATVRIGDQVRAKPPNGRCMIQWVRGVVTEVNFKTMYQSIVFCVTYWT